MMKDVVSFSDLLGRRFTRIVVSKDKAEIVFVAGGWQYIMRHHQDYCESSVTLEEIVGDMNDLLGAPIVRAEEKVSIGKLDYVVGEGKFEISREYTTTPPPLGAEDESYTWTFYTLATRKGYVDFRWYGTSNGYYSESVDIYEYRGGADKVPSDATVYELK